MLKDNLKIKIKNIENIIKLYIAWLKDNTKEEKPFAISKDYLVKAHYHEEEGRGGYFAPESGTSEGQFLTILGLLDAYEVIGDKDILEFAKNLSDAALIYLYKGDKLPDKNFTKEYIFSPHWLFNATNDDFCSERIYYNKKVKFVNGIGKINSDYNIKKLFSVRDLNGTLEWESPYSKIIGKQYEILENIINNNNIVIKLAQDYSGELIVVYSDLGGEKIKPSENYEANPVWRKLLKGESSCAVDSLWWSYQCFEKLYKNLGESKYKIILENMKGLIRFICKKESEVEYPYSPWILPFTVNTINNKLSEETGIPYVGYQAPWIWQKLNEEEGVLKSLKFIEDSTKAYKKITKTNKNYFAPVFLWSVWNFKDYGERNTFAFNGPDPNATWGGYQYRTLENVAKTLYYNNKLTLAKDIVENFLNDINKIWIDYMSNLITEFKENGELSRDYYSSHDVALLLRASLYAYKSNVIDKKLCIDLINKCLLSLKHHFNKKVFIKKDKLSRTWSTDGRWYMFWGGEILSSLSIFLKFYKNE